MMILMNPPDSRAHVFLAVCSIMVVVCSNTRLLNVINCGCSSLTTDWLILKIHSGHESKNRLESGHENLTIKNNFFVVLKIFRGTSVRIGIVQ